MIIKQNKALIFNWFWFLHHVTQQLSESKSTDNWIVITWHDVKWILRKMDCKIRCEEYLWTTTDVHVFNFKMNTIPLGAKCTHEESLNWKSFLFCMHENISYLIQGTWTWRARLARVCACYSMVMYRLPVHRIQSSLDPFKAAHLVGWSVAIGNSILATALTWAKTK